MATFRVGQRVKKVAQVKNTQEEKELRARLKSPVVPIGTEGTIRRQATGRRDWAVEFDGFYSGCGEGYFACFCNEITPIQPERNRVVSWEDCPIDPRTLQPETVS